MIKRTHNQVKYKYNTKQDQFHSWKHSTGRRTEHQWWTKGPEWWSIKESLNDWLYLYVCPLYIYI